MSRAGLGDVGLASKAPEPLAGRKRKADAAGLSGGKGVEAKAARTNKASASSSALIRSQSAGQVDETLWAGAAARSD